MKICTIISMREKLNLAGCCTELGGGPLGGSIAMAVVAASRGPGSFCVNVASAAWAAAAATRGPTIAARNATYKETTGCQGNRVYSSNIRSSKHRIQSEYNPHEAFGIYVTGISWKKTLSDDRFTKQVSSMEPLLALRKCKAWRYQNKRIYPFKGTFRNTEDLERGGYNKCSQTLVF